MVLSVTMTQIISTLARLLLWAWHSGHTPASQSALYPLLTDNMFLLDLLLCCRGWSHCSPQTW